MRKINRNDTADHGAESVRLGVDAAKKGKRAVRTAKDTAVKTARAAKTTVNLLRHLFVHVVAVLISPVTWIVLAIAFILYLLMMLLIILTGVAAQDNSDRQQAYANPVALGADVPEEIADAMVFYEAAVNTKKREFNEKIDALVFNTEDMPHNDTVYLLRNEPPAEYQTSLATETRKTQLKSAWELNMNEAEAIAIAYVILEREANEAHGSQGVLYPIAYTQDVFDAPVAEMVTITESVYENQACPTADCSVHYHEAANPEYEAAQAAYTEAVTRYDDWNENVVSRCNEYVAVMETYNNTPPAGQSYAQQQVEDAYFYFEQAVNNWSLVYGICGLTIDGTLGAEMQSQLYFDVQTAEQTLNSTPETTRTPYYTCDHLHTLHSFGLYFYSAEQVMQALEFTEDERQWAALIAMNIQQYFVEE